MFKDQLHALLISRLKQIKTEPKSYVFSVILPIIMLLIGLIVSKVLPAPSTEPVIFNFFNFQYFLFVFFFF